MSNEDLKAEVELLRKENAALRSERGRGLATALFAELRERLPGRECAAFVRRDNAASLRAHLKMGMKDVASFEHDGVAHAVLAFAAPHRT
jgi:L-amino acid N-acyltransferase YncA